MQPLDTLIAKAAARAQKRPVKPPASPKGRRNLEPVPGDPPLIAPDTVPSRVAPASYDGKSTAKVRADERRRVFAREFFFSGFKGEQAYRAAGYAGSKATISTQLGKLMKEPVVIDELNRLGQVAREAANAGAINCVEFWKEIIEANVFNFVEQDEEGLISIKPNLSKLPLGVQRTIKKIKVRKRTTYENDKDGEAQPVHTVETEVELWDRLGALNAIGKVQGLFDGKGDDVKRFAAILAERLTRHAKRVGRTINGEAQVLTR